MDRTEVGIAVAIVVFVCLGGWLVWRDSKPTSEPVTAYDGAPATLVRCSAPGDCMKESAKACPRGYDVLVRSERKGESTSYVVASGKNGGVAIPITGETFDGALMIRCKP